MSEASCNVLASALKSMPSHLRHLDLRGNQLLDSAIKLLEDFLLNRNCKLEILRSAYCLISIIFIHVLNVISLDNCPGEPAMASLPDAPRRCHLGQLQGCQLEAAVH